MLAGLTLVGLVPTAILTSVNGSIDEDPLFIPVAMMMIAGYSVTGAVLASRQPHNPIGWLLLAVGGLFLKTREPAREGTAIRVALALPHADGPRFCTLAGTVVRVVRDGRGLTSGLGVRFEDAEISPVDRITLQRFLQLQGGQVAVAVSR